MSPEKAVDLKAHYDRRGYVGPFTLFDVEELSQLNIVALIRTLKAAGGGEERFWGRNRHLDTPAIAQICRREQLVSCVRAVLSSDLLLWRTNLFVMSSRQLGFAWHQDEYRTLLSCPPDGAQCSVQINFTDSSELNDVSLIPESHKYDRADLERLGYVMEPGSDRDAYGTPSWGIPSDAKTVDVSLKAGQFYVFHSRLMHASLRARSMRGRMAKHRVTRAIGYGVRSILGMLSREDTVRYSLSLRITTPNATLFPAAFVETPARAAAVLLSGTDPRGIHTLARWPA